MAAPCFHAGFRALPPRGACTWTPARVGVHAHHSCHRSGQIQERRLCPRRGHRRVSLHELRDDALRKAPPAGQEQPTIVTLGACLLARRVPICASPSAYAAWSPTRPARLAWPNNLGWVGIRPHALKRRVRWGVLVHSALQHCARPGWAKEHAWWGRRRRRQRRRHRFVPQ